MQALLNDRKRLLPVLVTAVTIAVGAFLVIVLAGDDTGGGSGSASAQTDPSGAAQGGSGKVVKIPIKDFMFKPASISVKAGTKVSFTNEDSASHTATAKDSKPGFDSGTLDKGKTKVVTLAKAGTYNYICQFHPYMKGKIVVR